MNMVSSRKKDVKKLLAFCDPNDESQKFYDEMFGANSVPVNENDDIPKTNIFSHIFHLYKNSFEDRKQATDGLLKLKIV
ncbi:unnamed protein product [Parnassius apollo]|uniref:(apollo) hypothetical protein n=1 Tax=Parnassius apollo TaxID=110799 RepID=A0A8S3WFM2_PARAO|nr:unnamed protein product [Parnassius apollo]